MFVGKSTENITNVIFVLKSIVTRGSRVYVLPAVAPDDSNLQMFTCAQTALPSIADVIVAKEGANCIDRPLNW